MPSDEERINALEVDLTNLRERVAGLEAGAESTATKAEVEKAKLDVTKALIGIGVGISAVIIAAVGLAVAVLK